MVEAMTPPAPTPEELALAALYRCQEEHGPDAWLCYDCLCRLFLSHGHALATTHAQGREEGLEEAAKWIDRDICSETCTNPECIQGRTWIRAIRALSRAQEETR